ncbi:phytoene desaturase family protein [Pontibacter sp. G13]|uniref:phytoene desaturase family protein n=1 Tax=Pontibacter sp. G13 TaxID=3074898 RepID=UPI00288B68F9|nr:phytoene desaturase family protein [Pontibacter sp. G13]WNJ16390.1 phytoene desaturase family protein [Pontibacter sp. G13]
MEPQRIVVIGSGFAGLASASLLAQQGHQVTILEKNDQPGGRARQWKKDGFTFDMGPSWYWMPDVFESYFALFGKKVSDYYQLDRLDPSYRVFFGEEDQIDVPALVSDLAKIFEQLEPGSGPKLHQFLEQAAYKYEVGMRDYVHRPSLNITEFIDFRLIRESFRIQMFQSMSKHVRSYFSHPKLLKILEFPVLFLGATPQNTPALYSMMNHADLKLGTWYPMGGMNQIVQAMVAVAEEQGVEIKLNEEVLKIGVSNGKATHVETASGVLKADIVVANSDYRHTDQVLLDTPHRQYSPQYWENRTMSPSSLLYYLGVDGKVPNLKHHNLFFDEDFDAHAQEIYHDPQWPKKPLFYACVPSKTDASVAPEGKENVFLLVPLAPGLEDSEELREACFTKIMDRLERFTGTDIRSKLTIKRSYAMSDFEKDYHSFKGNAYGLANTLNQTAFFKPRLKSKKVSNLYYTGHLTVPGPGVPPSLISGQVVSSLIEDELKKVLV